MVTLQNHLSQEHGRTDGTNCPGDLLVGALFQCSSGCVDRQKLNASRGRLTIAVEEFCRQWTSRFASSSLRWDSITLAVNQFPVSVRRRGETASSDRRRRAHLARQGGRGDKRREREPAKRGPVGDLRKRLYRQQTAGKWLRGRKLAPHRGRVSNFCGLPDAADGNADCSGPEIPTVMLSWREIPVSYWYRDSSPRFRPYAAIQQETEPAGRGQQQEARTLHQVRER